MRRAGLEKAHSKLLGERAMAEAVGRVGGTSQYGPYYTSRHLIELLTENAKLMPSIMGLEYKQIEI